MNGDQLAIDECDATCAGTTEDEKCGGYDKITAYVMGGATAYQGCYRDARPRAMDDEGPYKPGSMTNEVSYNDKICILNLQCISLLIGGGLVQLLLASPHLQFVACVVNVGFGFCRISGCYWLSLSFLSMKSSRNSSRRKHAQLTGCLQRPHHSLSHRANLSAACLCVVNPYLVMKLCIAYCADLGHAYAGTQYATEVRMASTATGGTVLISSLYHSSRWPCSLYDIVDEPSRRNFYCVLSKEMYEPFNAEFSLFMGSWLTGWLSVWGLGKHASSAQVLVVRLKKCIVF